MPVVRPRSIGTYLFGMALAIIVPLLVFVVVLLAQIASAEKQASLRRTDREALSLASSISRQIQDTKTTLRLLATSPDLESGDLETFYSRTKAAMNSSPTFLLVVRADGQQLSNTRVPFETPLGKVANLESVQKALLSGKTDVSDAFFGQTSGKWVFNVTMPLERPNPSGATVLIITQNAEDLAHSLGTIGPDASMVLVDESNRILVTAGKAEGNVGDFYSSLPPSAFPYYSGVFEQGSNTVGYARPQDTHWRVIMWVPTVAVTSAVLNDWWILLLVGLILIGVALGAAFFLSRQLRTPIKSIADMAERLGLGEIVSPIKTPIEEVNKVGIALTEASYERSEAERRLWYTMREAVHRTKNMMSVVQAMMRQTARHSATVEEFRSKMQGRLTGLAHTVDLLTAEEWTGTSMRQLAKSHLDAFSMENGRISVIGEDFMVRPEVVQALGMALHELGTNAVKYGALSNRQGTIVFSWQTNRVDGSETIFRWIEKDGPVIEPPDKTGFGTALLDGFVAAAVNGRVQLQYFPSGLVWQLTAPKSSVEAVREKPLLRPKSSPVAATF